MLKEVDEAEVVRKRIGELRVLYDVDGNGNGKLLKKFGVVNDVDIFVPPSFSRELDKDDVLELSVCLRRLQHLFRKHRFVVKELTIDEDR